MLVHLNAIARTPRRTVVIGAGGFVGGAIVERLRAEGAPVLAVSRQEVDLQAAAAADQLRAMLQPGDAIVAAAARAPCRNIAMLIDNMLITKAMLEALAGAEPSHVVNISSDAVYPDEPLPLSEATPPSPSTLHGAMHLAREIAFGEAVTAPLAIVRPSLIYGAADPHNGYGPNRFRRLANAGEDIVLFGAGEERRDHVLVDDVAELVVRMLKHRSRGILNAASGEVHSFRDVAARAIALAGRPATISASPRRAPMPHNGYRPFATDTVRTAFPDFSYTGLEEGMARAQQASVKQAS
jgi:nucleoside-diphosphate-sugar epimerase